MKIDKLKLTNFRNHDSVNLEFTDKVNLIKGANAIGKTNILEAIYFLCTTKSFRAQYDRDTITHGKDFTRLEASAHNDEEKVVLELLITKDPEQENGARKKVKVNKVAKSLQRFSGNLNGVLFSPEDIDLLTGSPSARRKYMDMILIQTDPHYRKAHSEYQKAVRFRNKILEKIRDTSRGWDEIGFWDNKIVHNGTFIQNSRQKLLDYLNNQVKKYGNELGGGELSVKYLPSEISEQKLKDHRQAEIASKSTLIGPHRDDFEMFLNNYSISEFASRGQQRTAVLAMKLGEIDYFLEITDKRPILLLDDIFSELDETHEYAVLKVVGLQQTIITATEEPDIPNVNAHIIAFPLPNQ